VSEKARFAAGLAREVAAELLAELRPACEPERCVVAGSLRREQEEVGDLEIVYVPRCTVAVPPGEMLAQVTVASTEVLDRLLKRGTIAKRENARGSITWGDLIKLGRHVATGLPVDFFTSSMPTWWNYLVCRTGPAESNIAIARAAATRGWRWAPYSEGFYDMRDPMRLHKVTSEREVFEFVGLEYKEPKDR